MPFQGSVPIKEEQGGFGGAPVIPAPANQFGTASGLPTAAQRPPQHYAFDPSIAAARTGTEGGFWGDLAERFNRQRLNLQSGLMLGGAEEARAALQAAPEAAMNWYRGGEFDFSKRYMPLLQQMESAKELRSAQNPVASRVEQTLGGAATALGLGGAGVTLAGRTIPAVGKIVPAWAEQLGLATTEGGAYGSVQGALEAKPGERLAGAVKGARVGALTAAAFQGAGTGLSAIDDIFAKRGITPPSVTSESLKQLGSNFYKRAEAEGVRYSSDAVDRLRVNMRAAAGRLDPQGRPTTAAITRDVLKRPAGSMAFEEFHDVQKRISRALRDKNVSDEDKHFLEQIRNATDSFASTVNPAQDISSNIGDPLKAYAYKKAADKIWVRYKKSEFVENIMDLADVIGEGKLTQSGVANAVKQLTRTEYKKIVAGNPSAQWDKSEIADIRQMSKGGSSSKTVNWLARFAPRGPVSAALTQAASGQLIGGIAAALGVPPIISQSVPLVVAGVAARKADQSAMDALESFRSRVAGEPPRPPVPPSPPFQAGAIIPATVLDEERRLRAQRGF